VNSAPQILAGDVAVLARDLSRILTRPPALKHPELKKLAKQASWALMSWPFYTNPSPMSINICVKVCPQEAFFSAISSEQALCCPKNLGPSSGDPGGAAIVQARQLVSAPGLEELKRLIYGPASELQTLRPAKSPKDSL
jgi:hypothetical protein